MSELIRLTAIGDVAAVKGFEQQFLQATLEEVVAPQIITLLRESDLAMANIECVLTDSDEFAVPGYGLRCAPVIAGSFRAMGIDLATLANNHICDVGNKGVLDTIQNLQQAGITTCGAGHDASSAAQPYFVDCRELRIGVLAVAEKEYNIATDFSAGAALFEPLTWESQIRALRRQCDVALVSVHAGHEFCPVPSPRIRQAYRAAIDFGAHAVIGHHPHVLQGIETYRGCPIFYSLGNFCFDSNYVSSYEGWNSSVVLELRLCASGVEGYQLHPIEICLGHRVGVPDESRAATIITEIKRLSAILQEPEQYAKTWQEFVRWRCERDYLPHFYNLSERLAKPDNFLAARHFKNYFQCPTHVELLNTYFGLLF